ncbi:hypothetical protein J6590_075055 [Homalodisca vitripennis]|nr:hypothetical protein J6590_075055 [Homalodisca vitripennis]
MSKAKYVYHFNLDNQMDFEERFITNYKFLNVGVKISGRYIYFTADSSLEAQCPPAIKPSLSHNLKTTGLKRPSKPSPIAGQADYLQGQNQLAVTHPSSSHRTWLDSVI